MSQDATIALLPGDGIGPEVIAAARAVLEAVASSFGMRFAFTEALIGGAAIDRAGVPLPDETVATCMRADAVMLGAVGGPQWDAGPEACRPAAGLLGIRCALGLFANLRPVRCHAVLAGASPFRPEHLAGVDFVVVRELTGGIYFGEKRRETVSSGTRAVDVCSYDTAEIERIVRTAAGVARARSGRLVSVDKANVLETSRLWRETATRVVSIEYPDVELTHMLVDTCAMQLVLRPRDFDVVVTENMFGDILTDEAAALTGSIGLLPSASLGEGGEGGEGGAGEGGVGARRRGLYEPIHGSAPALAGRGLANPIGAVLSAAMLLRHSLGCEAQARAVEDAVEHVIASGRLTPDVGVPGRGSATTAETTAAIVAEVGGGAP